MKKHLLILISAIILSVSSLRAEETSRYILEVGDFDRLLVVDGINVVYSCSEDSAGLAVYDTTRSVADQLIFDFSKKGRLMIQKQFHDENALSVGLPTVRVYSRFLTKAENSGDSTLIVASVAPCPEFKATVIGNGSLSVRNISCTRFDGSIKTGNGRLTVTGTAEKAVFNNTGVGSIQADGLKAAQVSCRFFGTGTTGVWATETLSIKGMFPGKLYYKGDPAKIRNYSIGVKTFKLDTPEN